MQWIGHDGLAFRLTKSLLRKQLATKTVSSRPFGSTSGGSRGRRKHHPTMTVSGQSLTDPRNSMKAKRARNCHRIISADIPHINRAQNIYSPQNYVKHKICIGTWNVTSLVSNSSKLYQLSKSIDEYKLDLLGITETHMPGTGTEVLPNGSLLFYSGRADGHKRQGVGFTLSKRIKNSLISYTPVSQRVITARLHSRHINISVVVAYAPTEGSCDSDKDEFYQQLEDTLSSLPRYDIKLLLGDFNARIGTDYSSWPGIIGKHSLHSSANDNGTRMLDLCTMNELTIGGTLFEHRNIHKGTWRSPDGRTVTQIDHICISTRWNHSLLDVKSCRGADIGSDHYLVRGFLRIKLNNNRAQKSASVRAPALERLRDRSKVMEYNEALSQRFHQSPIDCTSLDSAWTSFKENVSEVSMDILGKRPTKRNEQHLSVETRQLLKERTVVKRKEPTAENRANYSKINKMVKKSCKSDDNNWASRIADDLENAALLGKQREVWQKISVLSNNSKKKSTVVRDKSGKLISDPTSQRSRWEEHFSELLNPSSENIDLDELVLPPSSPYFENLSDEDPPPSLFEIEKALTRLKNYKSPGVDGLSNEELKYGSRALSLELNKIFDMVWSGESIPSEWSKGIIVVLGKKGDTSYCSNNRGITLRSTASKVFQIILLQRLYDGLEGLYRENQCGFRRNRSCIDQLHSLRLIIYNSLEYNVPLYINFIDFKAAFDSIHREFIWKAFEHYGLPSKYIRVIKAFFDSTVSAVRVNGELTDWFEVKSGTGQGDIQGPPVFNVCMNLVMELVEFYKRVSKGMLLEKSWCPEVRDVTVVDVDYADDLAALDNTKEGLQETTDLIVKYSAYSGLAVNVGKTEAMAVSKQASQMPYTENDTLAISIGDEIVKQCSEFKYLGAIICGDNNLARELTARIGKATGAFNRLNNIWNSRSISISVKIRIYKAAVITVLTYGCEVWNTTQAQMKRLESFHQRCLRRILKVRWFHRVTNVEVLRRASTTPLESHVASMRLRWYGHAVRMPGDRLPHYLVDWVPKHGKRNRGRPKKSWLKVVEEDFNHVTGSADATHLDMKIIAVDRNRWKKTLDAAGNSAVT